jgi:hypothetical protein
LIENLLGGVTFRSIFASLCSRTQFLLSRARTHRPSRHKPLSSSALQQARSLRPQSRGCGTCESANSLRIKDASMLKTSISVCVCDIDCGCHHQNGESMRVNVDRFQNGDGRCGWPPTHDGRCPISLGPSVKQTMVPDICGEPWCVALQSASAMGPTGQRPRPPAPR